MSEEKFSSLLPRLSPWTDYLYFHLMGEPLLHPDLSAFLKLARDNGFKVILTTNGTLLEDRKEILLSSSALWKVNISLQSFEGNDPENKSRTLKEYMQKCIFFGKAAEGRCIVVYRLWNIGGLSDMNEGILSLLKASFDGPWVEEKKGIRIGEKIYLEFGEKFDWPDLNEDMRSDVHYCYGLKDQIGILWDGTVVPCCLDHEGDLALGNIFSEDLEDIIKSDRACQILKGFNDRKPTEALCQRCGYASRFH